MLIQEAHRETDRLAGNLFSHFCQLLKEQQASFDLGDTLLRLGVTPSSPDIATSAISLQQYYQLLELAAPQLQGSGFYLQLGNRFDITDAGVLGYASLSVENLRQSWELTTKSYALYPHPLSARRQILNERVIIELPAPARAIVNPTYLQEEWLASTWKWMCQRLPEIENNAELQLKLAYPPPAYKQLYSDFFPGKILFDQEVTELSFPESWYDIPFPSANPSTAKLCQQQCLLIMGQLDKQTDLVDQVRRLLLLTPQREFPSLEAMAEEFQIPSHTFHRRLKKSGVSYRHIVNEVRMRLAKDYLENTTLPLQEISYLLGYEYAPNFFRAFKKWFNVTADQCRQASVESP